MRASFAAAMTAALLATVAAPTVLTRPAGAATGGFAATCITTGIHGPMTDTRSISFSATAPDSVAPGSSFTLPVTVGYPVSSIATAGAAEFAVSGATPDQVGIAAAPGASQIAGALALTASETPGGVISVSLGRFGAFAQIGSFQATDICQPSRPLEVARIAVGVPLVSIGDGAIVEGSTGTRGLQLAVTLSRPAATDVTVPFTVEPGTATLGSDYTTPSGTVTIHAGQASGIATVRVRGDAAVEPKENFRVRLHDPVGAAIGRAVGTGRIIDDDPERGPRISIGDASVVEGNRAVRSMRFVVSLSEPATQDTWFHYWTVDGTAIAANGDYRAQESDYFVPAGHSSITVPVPVPTDLTPEPTKSFVVRLGVSVVGPGITIGRANGVGTIIDDD